MDPPYSHDLSPCGLYLFPKIKNAVKEQRYDMVELKRHQKYNDKPFNKGNLKLLQKMGSAQQMNRYLINLVVFVRLLYQWIKSYRTQVLYYTSIIYVFSKLSKFCQRSLISYITN